MALFFMPYYIDTMGAEAFALIGVFIALSNILSIIDMGISPTLNRELAAGSVSNNIEIMRNTLRSLEYIYIPMLALLALLLLALSPMIAEGWLNHNKLPVSVITQSIQLMSVVIALHFLINFYSAGILGLQLQVVFNIINAVMITIRYMGVIPIMLYFSPSPVVFFLWQLLVSLIHVFLVKSVLWNKISLSEHQPIFNPKIIHSIWRFSIGVSLINILGVLTMNMDKIFLSKMLSLEEFGYYSMASIIAMSIAPRLASPFFTAFYPNFTQCIKLNARDKLISLYHQGSFLVAMATIPITVFIVFYANPILLLWTDSPVITEHTSTLLVLLTIGCFFNAIMYIPYAIQLAYGWTTLTIYSNAISLLSIIPLMIYLYSDYGVDGVAYAWLIVNLLATVIGINIMHNRLLKGEGTRWFIYDNGLILLLVLIAVVILMAVNNGHSLWQLGLVLGSLYLMPLLIVPKQIRNIIHSIRERFNHGSK